MKKELGTSPAERQAQVAETSMEAPFNPLISASPEAVGERMVRIILGEDMLTADEVSQMRRTSSPS